MKKTVFLMAMMSAVALVSVSCRNGGDDKPVTTTGKEVPLSAQKLNQIGKFDLVSITSNIPVDINKDGVKNTDWLKEINLCNKEIDNEIVFDSPTTYEFNNSCSKRNVDKGVFEVNENNKTLIFLRKNIEDTNNPYRVGHSTYDVSLTEKDGKYYLKYKMDGVEEVVGKGVIMTLSYKSR